MNRRHFLKRSSGAVALAAAARYVPTTFAATKPRRVALVGCGWYGKGSLLRMLQVEPAEVVALCDVDRRMLAGAAEIVSQRQQSGKRPRGYGDYRKLLAEEKPDIVMVSTPDHWHALIALEAMKSGADVYLEKPISVDVLEGRSLVAAARKYGRIVQVNMQRRSTPHLVEAVQQVIQEGRLGTVGHVEICCYWGMGRAGNRPDVPVPDYLDYDMWTGPAPMRPFNQRTHPRGWRAFMEYCNGIVGDMCVHMLDMVRWMLGLGWPVGISSTGGIYVEKDSNANSTDTQTAVFDFGNLQVVWKHRTYGDMPDPDYPWAGIIYGSKGTLKASVFKYEFFERGKKEPTLSRNALLEYDKYPEDRTEKDLERHVASAMRAHWRNYLECVDQRTQPVSNINEGYISSSSCILANVSQQLGGRLLRYDPRTGKVVGDPEATLLLERPYRAPWSHPRPEKV